MPLNIENRYSNILASQVVLVVKDPPTNAGDMRQGFNPWMRKVSQGRKQYTTSVFFLENPMDREAWQAAVYGAAKSQT